jgi:hypothetical protein
MGMPCLLALHAITANMLATYELTMLFIIMKLWLASVYTEPSGWSVLYPNQRTECRSKTHFTQASYRPPALALKELANRFHHDVPGVRNWLFHEPGPPSPWHIRREVLRLSCHLQSRRFPLNYVFRLTKYSYLARHPPSIFRDVLSSFSPATLQRYV